jgi:hypothetical protein
MTSVTTNASEPDMTSDDMTVVIATDGDSVAARARGERPSRGMGLPPAEIAARRDSGLRARAQHALHAKHGEIVLRSRGDSRSAECNTAVTP